MNLWPYYEILQSPPRSCILHSKNPERTYHTYSPYLHARISISTMCHTQLENKCVILALMYWLADDETLRPTAASFGSGR